MTPETSDKTFSQKARAAIGGFAASAQAATQLAAKQAERTKLTSVTLPHAYRELGRDIHATGRYRDQFPDEFAKADELKGRIAGLRQAAPHKEGETKSFTDRAKETAGKARDAAHAKTLEVELNSVLRKLGRAAFEKLGKGSGAPALTGPIEQCQQRLATLDAEIQAIDSSATSGVLTPRRLLVGAGALVVLVLCLGAWAMFGGGGSEPQVAGIPKSGLKSAQTPVTDEIPTGVPDVGDVVGDARSRLGDMTRRIEEQRYSPRPNANEPNTPAPGDTVMDQAIGETPQTVQRHEIPAPLEPESTAPSIALKKVREFDVAEDHVRGVAFSQDGQLVAISARSDAGKGRVLLYDVATGTRRRMIETGLLALNWDVGGMPMLWLDTITLSIMRDDSENVVALRAGSGTTWAPHGFVAMVKDGDWILTDKVVEVGDKKCTGVQLWDMNSGSTLREFSQPTDSKALTVSPDGKWLLSATDDDQAVLWDLSTGEKIRVFDGHEHEIYSGAFSPDNQQVLTGSIDKAILWDATTGRQLRAFQSRSSWITSVAFSRDGRQAITGGPVVVWDVSTGEQLHRLEGSFRPRAGDPYRNVHACAPVIPSPDGKWILTGSKAGPYAIWEAATGKPVHVLDEIKVENFSSDCFISHTFFAFSPDGTYLLAGTNPATLWSISVGSDSSTAEVRSERSTSTAANETERSIDALRRMGAEEVSQDRVDLWGMQNADKALEHLKHLPDISALYLNESDVTDTGLANLAGLRNLALLSLNDTGISDAGLAHLAALKLSERMTLDVGKTKVTDRGLQHVDGLPIVLLLFGESKITNTGLRRFAQVHPKCRFKWSWSDARTYSELESNDMEGSHAGSQDETPLQAIVVTAKGKSLERMDFGHGVHGLKAWKSDGSLTIEFAFDRQKVPVLIEARSGLSVFLYDRNGQLLTQFQTTDSFFPPGSGAYAGCMRLKQAGAINYNPVLLKEYQRLVYRVSVRDLRDAERVAIAFTHFHMED